MRHLFLSAFLFCSLLPAQSIAPGWKLISPKTGDLPAPNPGLQQTSCTVFDIDGDMDILVKPFNHETPALQILLNQSKGH